MQWKKFKSATPTWATRIEQEGKTFRVVVAKGRIPRLRRVGWHAHATLWPDFDRDVIEWRQQWGEGLTREDAAANAIAALAE